MALFCLTSGHVITSFQGIEEPSAKLWTGLLKAQEENPDVSGGPRGTAKPIPTAPDAPESFLHITQQVLTAPGHGAVLPIPCPAGAQPDLLTPVSCYISTS